MPSNLRELLQAKPLLQPLAAESVQISISTSKREKKALLGRLRAIGFSSAGPKEAVSF